MCTDERCRHPYTCECEDQCGGKPLPFCSYCGNEGHDADDCDDAPEDDDRYSVPCPECGAGTWIEEGHVCYVCTEDGLDRLVRHLQGGMIPSDFVFGMAKRLAHDVRRLKPEAVTWA